MVSDLRGADDGLHELVLITPRHPDERRAFDDGAGGGPIVERDGPGLPYGPACARIRLMRILVIGGVQFMGRRIVERLLERGHDVTVLHRRATHDLGPQVRNLQADRGDLPLVAQLLRRESFDAVFDLAYDWEKGTPATHVEAAARNCGDRLQRYVFVSSVAAYPPGLGLRESDALVPDDVPDPYALHKASAERLLFGMHQASGFPVVTVRPPFVHGPRQPFYREQFFWDRMFDGRPIVLPDGGTLHAVGVRR